MRGGGRTFRRTVAVAALLLALVAVVGPADPAAAAPSLSVSPATGLNPERDFVTVTGRGFNPNIQLFVMQCRSTSGEDHTCNSVGLQKVTTDASGSFTRGGVMVTARFGATDCTTTPCAIKTSIVQGHSGDRSQDRLARISFGSAPTPPTTPPPATTAPPVVTTPSTAPPAATTTTTTAGATTSTTVGDEATTTTVAETTTTVEAATTTAVDDTADDEATTSTTAATEVLGASDADGDDDGSSALPIVLGVIALLAAAGGAAVYFVRRQRASAT